MTADRETMRRLDVLWRERKQREMTAATEVGTPVDTVPADEEIDYEEETKRIFRGGVLTVAEDAPWEIKHYGPTVYVLVLNKEIVGVYNNHQSADQGAINKSRAEAERVPGTTATVQTYQWPVLS